MDISWPDMDVPKEKATVFVVGMYRYLSFGVWTVDKVGCAFIQFGNCVPIGAFK